MTILLFRTNMERYFIKALKIFDYARLKNHTIQIILSQSFSVILNIIQLLH